MFSVPREPFLHLVEERFRNDRRHLHTNPIFPRSFHEFARRVLDVINRVRIFAHRPHGIEVAYAEIHLVAEHTLEERHPPYVPAVFRRRILCFKLSRDLAHTNRFLRICLEDLPYDCRFRFVDCIVWRGGRCPSMIIVSVDVVAAGDKDSLGDPVLPRSYRSLDYFRALELGHGAEHVEHEFVLRILDVIPPLNDDAFPVLQHFRDDDVLIGRLAGKAVDIPEVDRIKEIRLKISS